MRLSISAVADRCQVSKTRVIDWILAKKLTAGIDEDGRYIIEERDLRSFLEKSSPPVEQ